MFTGKNPRQSVVSWLFVSGLALLCGCLGFLQYRWIGGVSVAAHDRLRASLQASLHRLSQDFNSEITANCRALVPAESQTTDVRAMEAEVAQRFGQWKASSRHRRMFRRIAFVLQKNDSAVLEGLNLETGEFHRMEWPAEWNPVRERMLTRFLWMSGQPPKMPAIPQEEPGLVFEIPVHGMFQPGPPSELFAQQQRASLIFDLDAENLRSVVLPEYLQRYLGDDKGLEYHVTVLTRAERPSVVYDSEPHSSDSSVLGADASTGLLELQYDQILGPRVAGRAGLGMPGMAGRRQSFGIGPGPRFSTGGVRTAGLQEAGLRPDFGRWRLFAQHRSGSLEAVVESARLRNLGVAAGLLLLILASVAMLIRFTRRAQRLAELQMDFVAGVSHELRTPLTTIHTAAYNLRGRIANDPVQVERYGA